MEWFGHQGRWGMSNFRDVDRQTGFLLPPSVDEWLPQRHLARFVVEVIDGLDLRALVGRYRGSGSASYHPSMLLGLLVYGYATGVFSSRKLERATYDSVAFRFIAANDHPDHDTIATFRRRFLKEITELFVKVLMLGRQMGVLQLGTVALDGTKIHANASRHRALSYEHAGKLEAQLKAEVRTLLAKAEAADKADIPDGMSIPQELERREERLKKLAEVRRKIEARAGERLAREQAEYEAKRGQDQGTRQEAWRQAAGTAGRGSRAQRPDQPDRRGIADHAGGRRRLRAMLQRTSRGDGRQPAGHRHRCRAGRQRQATSRADAWRAGGVTSRSGPATNPARRQRLFQRRQCCRLRRGRPCSAARSRPHAASPLPGRALCRGAAS